MKREVSDRRNESMSFTFRSAERGGRCKECVKKVDSNALDAREILPSFFLWKEETQTENPLSENSQFIVTLVMLTAFPLL